MWSIFNRWASDYSPGEQKLGFPSSLLLNFHSAHSKLIKEIQNKKKNNKKLNKKQKQKDN